MNSTDLGFFAAVVSAGGIGRAATKLNTVQSNVTQRIRELERELGVQLFYRSRAGVTLTSSGRKLVPYADAVARLIGDARKAVQEDGIPQGELRLGAMETTAALRLPPILKTYAAKFPLVDVQIETGPTHWLIDRVLDRQLDGAFVCGPVKHGDLATKPVVTEQLVLLTPTSVSALKDLNSNQEGTSLKAIVFRAGCSYRQRLIEFLGQQGVSGMRWMEMGTLDGIIGCVASSVGVSILPISVAQAANHLGLINLHQLPRHLAMAETVFVHRKDAFLSAAMKALLDQGAPDQR